MYNRCFRVLSQDELKAELAELEQEDLNERLMGADHVPVHQPAGASRVSESEFSAEVIRNRHLLTRLPDFFSFVPINVILYSTCKNTRRRRGSGAQGASSCTGYVTTSTILAHPRTFHGGLITLAVRRFYDTYLYGGSSLGPSYFAHVVLGVR